MCRRLAEAGCSASQIAAISGHSTLREVERYTKAADRKRMATDAMNAIGVKSETSVENSLSQVENSRRNSLKGNDK